MHRAIALRAKTALTVSFFALLAWAVPASAAPFGGFAPPQTFPMPDGSSHMIAVDVDGDGDPDVVATLFTPDTFDVIVVFFNDGNASFSAGTLYGVGSAPIWVEAADMNADGSPDLIVANRDTDDVSVLINNGNGTFAAEDITSVGDEPESVGIADFNRDGQLDIVAANASDNNVSVLINDGSGTNYTRTDYSTTDNGGTTGLRPEAVAAGDINFDGAPDIITGNTTSDNLTILYGNGDGTFATGDFAIFVDTSSDPLDIELLDVGGDGDPDLVVACGGAGEISVHYNDYDGGSSPFPTFPTANQFAAAGRPVHVDLADLEGDGDPDIITAKEITGEIDLLFNDGNGVFSGTISLPAGSSPDSGVGADLDGDGDIDIVAGDLFDDTLRVYINQTNFEPGMPVARIDLPADWGISDCLCGVVNVKGVADVDGDGFASFTLDYRAADDASGTWTTIATGNTPIAEPGGVIGNWDTAALPGEGFYILRLRAANTAGDVATDKVFIRVSQNISTTEFIFRNGLGATFSNADIVGANVCIYGTLFDSFCGFDRYRVEYAPLGSGSYTTIVESSGSFVNETIVTWDSRDVPDGEYTVRVRTIEDDCGFTNSMSRAVEVDNTPPIARIDMPTNCEVFPLNSTVTIEGEVFDDNLAGWTLAVTGGPWNNWQSITPGSQPDNVNGVLWNWDTSDLPACAYTIRLRASDQAILNCGSSRHVREFYVSINLGAVGDADLDNDGDVDIDDFELFQQQFTGPLP